MLVQSCTGASTGAAPANGTTALLYTGPIRVGPPATAWAMAALLRTARISAEGGPEESTAVDQDELAEGSEVPDAEAAQEEEKATPGSPLFSELEQLRKLYSDFVNNPDNVELRNQIISLVKTVPAWASDKLISPDIRKKFNQALTQLKNASTGDDSASAGSFFDQVTALAPWYSAAYLDAANAFAKAGQFDLAKRDLELYDMAVRLGTDTTQASNLRTYIQQAIAAKLEAIRTQLKKLNINITFTVGYNPALDVPLEKLAGLKVPPDFNDETIAKVNQRGAELREADLQSALAAEYNLKL